MNAETLRRAAALMRERAGAARDADRSDSWTAVPTIDPENDGWVVAHDPPDADWDTTGAGCVYDFDGEVSRHIASWHPTVALAVADWLVDEAVGIESGNWRPCVQGALAVATAYLNEEPA